MRFKPVLLVSLLAAICMSAASACDETVKIGDSTYAIDDIWCGLRVDTTRIPVYEDLGKIPKQFCYNENKIYIRKDARDAFVAMAEAALEDSVTLLVQSGYRSAGYQASLVKKRMLTGKTFAEVIRYVAPPGYSEHELGNSIDLKAVKTQFYQSAAYAWLKEHAAQYGFIERYPKDNTTLKSWEPWHWTYIGTGEQE